ncbi:MAG: prephenate dehydrogenase/arogenate dehydrogenase family protein [bacterium]
MQTWLIFGVSGQFGRFMAEFFLRHGKNVIGISRSQPAKELMQNKRFSYFQGDGTKKLSKEALQAVQSADVIMFSVPIALTEVCIQKVGPLLRAGQLITDVTSVKQRPVEAMLNSVSEEVEILGMHPLFSPTLTLENKNVILVPERIAREKLQEVVAMFEDDKAKVSIMTAKEHDHMMAVMQGLAHFLFLALGKTLSERKWKFAEYEDKKTTFYTLVKSLLDRVVSFDPALYAEIQLYNPQVPEVLSHFLEDAETLKEFIVQGEEKKLKKNLESIQKAVKTDDDIVEKTNAMYSLLEE